MLFYQIPLSLDSSQSEIVDTLKNNGIEVIQLSDGLCLKTTESLENIKKILKDLKPAPTIRSITTDSVKSDPEASENLKSFMGV